MRSDSSRSEAPYEVREAVNHELSGGNSKRNSTGVCYPFADDFGRGSDVSRKRSKLSCRRRTRRSTRQLSQSRALFRSRRSCCLKRSRNETRQFGRIGMRSAVIHPKITDAGDVSRETLDAFRPTGACVRSTVGAEAGQIHGTTRGNSIRWALAFGSHSPKIANARAMSRERSKRFVRAELMFEALSELSEAVKSRTDDAIGGYALVGSYSSHHQDAGGVSRERSKSPVRPELCSEGPSELSEAGPIQGLRRGKSGRKRIGGGGHLAGDC
jgi:hypothetical protein